MNRLLSLLERVAVLKSRRHRTRPAPRRVRPSLESLEDRCVPSTLTELAPLPTANAAPTGITTAPNGSVWFTEKNANKVARLTTAGVLTEYAIPTANSAPEKITASPDGNVWFTERTGRKIGRINQAGGAIAEFAFPSPATSAEFATAITTRSDGTVWFASNQQPNLARIAKISATGVMTYVPTSQTKSYFTDLVNGPDGNLWVTSVSSYWGDSVVKVNTAGWGTYTNYRLAAGSGPQSITVGPDNNLWFTEANTNKLGRITTTGLMLPEIALAAGSAPQQIVRGKDGALWFTEMGGNKIGRVTTTGVVTEFAVPTAGSQPFGITVGLDGTLWFTEQNGNRVGKVVLS
jgi:streptogramin lyase